MIVNVTMNKLWEIWKYSIGSFSDDKTKPYDNYVAGIRTIIFISYMVTNCFIIGGVIRHWNSNVPDQKSHITNPSQEVI